MILQFQDSPPIGGCTAGKPCLYADGNAVLSSLNFDDASELKCAPHPPPSSLNSRPQTLVQGLEIQFNSIGTHCVIAGLPHAAAPPGPGSGPGIAGAGAC